MMNSTLCEELGFECPVFAYSRSKDVVKAVSKAGGIGVFGAANLTPNTLDSELICLYRFKLQ